MSNYTKWLKRGLRICVKNDEILEDQKIKEFNQLAQEYIKFTENEKRELIEIINLSLEENDKIYVYSYFAYYTKLEDFKREALYIILKKDFNFYIGSMLELQIINILGCYKEKRILHKRNIDKFLDVLKVDYSYIPMEKRDKNRIIIITEQILSPLHAPTKEVMNIAYVLQKKMGYNVLLFSCPCDGVLPEELWYKGMRMNSIEDFRNKVIKIGYRDEMFYGYQINMLPINIKEYQMMIDLIYAWNSFFVLAIGVINPIVDLIGKFTSIVVRPVSNKCPVSEAEILFIPTKWTNELEIEYTKIISKNQKLIFMEEKMPIVIEKSQNSYTREEKGLPDDKFLIAIVGNRLDEEIDMDFIIMCKRIIEKVSKVAFVVVGNVEKVKTYFSSDKIFNNHVFYLGYCTDLVGIYGILDLYLNPRRGGGGYSSVMALKAGIPVVSLPKCDVAENVGEEYVVNDYFEMEDIVYRYIRDVEFYKEKSLLAYKKMEKSTDYEMEQYVKKMIDKITSVMNIQENK